jgi:hypothetical protein
MVPGKAVVVESLHPSVLSEPPGGEASAELPIPLEEGHLRGSREPECCDETT